ncbi:glucose 1-dehydrogenase [Specibacter sp. NPDC078692]|uniref:SDR family NAD(P)-dependent oxidoreductase n=1 Tax=Specibacter sp. NPDC078692 TaxID=3155818 RepID=UPI00343EB07C
MFSENQVALVTAAGAGIGRAIALRLATDGASIIVSDVNDEAGAETVSLIVAAGGRAVYKHANVANVEEVNALVPFAIESFGRLDMAVNNAGVGSMPTPMQEVTAEVWDRAINVTLRGTFMAMQSQVAHFMEQGRGSIVNIASLAGISATPYLTPYGASTHGVVSLTRSVAKETAEQGIRVNAVAPGAIETAALASLPIEAQTAYAAEIPMKHLGQPEDIANATAFLLSDQAAFITGVVLRVDGGTEA